MLVDTSVWIDHLRHGDSELAAALEAGQVDMHPFVVGELACGNLRARVPTYWACCLRYRPLRWLPTMRFYFLSTSTN